MGFIQKHKLTLIGVVVGAIVGFIYWQQVGCMSGTCSITSSPINSTLYASFMGGLIGNMFKKEKTEQT